ncbi:DUF3024 domain-containing protein [Micromonospora lupini]|uniref:DUF3024 domain-containing protein n=1 Tax=Micromonospora lupini TaxID=285679 RepID=UPI00338E2DFE
MGALPEDRAAAIHDDNRHLGPVLPSRNLRFHRYDHAPPSAAVNLLLEEISRDPTGIFWGC